MKKIVAGILLVLSFSVGQVLAAAVPLTVVGTDHFDQSYRSVRRAWAHLTPTNSTGAPFDTRRFTSLEIQIKGTWDGTPGTLVIQGSHDSTDGANGNWATLTGLPIGVPTAVSYSADPAVTLPVWEMPTWIKAVLSGAGATTDVTVTIEGK